MWSDWATSSLPVPLSPSMSTVARVGATWRMRSKISTMGGELPMMFSRPNFLSSSSRNRRFSLSTLREWSARMSTASSFSRSSGLVM